MKKYLALLKYEFKTIVRDSINLYMIIFPIIILIMTAYVFPLLFKSINNGPALRVTMLLLLIFILAMGSYFLAAMATFLLLEHKDECTLNTIAVTPLGTKGYIQFKMTYIYLMSLFSTVLILYGTKLLASKEYVINSISLFVNINLFHIIAFAAVNSLFVPSLALMQAAFARNKVEGFAYIKGTGIIALIPALLIIPGFSGITQYILGVFPNFWAIKGMIITFLPNGEVMNLPFWGYLLIGLIYNSLIIVFSMRFFLKKAEY